MARRPEPNHGQLFHSNGHAGPIVLHRFGRQRCLQPGEHFRQRGGQHQFGGGTREFALRNQRGRHHVDHQRTRRGLGFRNGLELGFAKRGLRGLGRGHQLPLRFAHLASRPQHDGERRLHGVAQSAGRGPDRRQCRDLLQWQRHPHSLGRHQLRRAPVGGADRLDEPKAGPGGAAECGFPEPRRVFPGQGRGLRGGVSRHHHRQQFQRGQPELVQRGGRV